MCVMKKNKTLIQNSITYAIVIGAWALMTVLSSTGHMSSLMKGLLVPICIYVILAVSLNLTVGILGELSLGHAGFMCVGAFSGAFFTNCMENVIPSVGLRFFLALLLTIILIMPLWSHTMLCGFRLVCLATSYLKS